VNFPVRESDRRAGDAIALYNDPTRIESQLGWKAKITDIDDIVGSAYRWLREHPQGYGD